MDSLPGLFDFPSCGHVGTYFTVTRLQEGNAVIICQQCFDSVKKEDKAARRKMITVVESPCFLCDSHINVRLNVDLGLCVCDQCLLQSEATEQKHQDFFVPRSDCTPDEISPGHLFIGPKESAYNIDTLISLDIKRVLICCEDLPGVQSITHRTRRKH